jgi:hypothetical protein
LIAAGAPPLHLGKHFRDRRHRRFRPLDDDAIVVKARLAIDAAFRTRDLGRLEGEIRARLSALHKKGT